MNLTTKHSKAIAILEKIPGVNTIQIADFNKFFINLERLLAPLPGIP